MRTDLALRLILPLILLACGGPASAAAGTLTSSQSAAIDRYIRAEMARRPALAGEGLRAGERG